MTTTASLPSRIDPITSRWPSRKSSKPKCFWSEEIASVSECMRESLSIRTNPRQKSYVSRVGQAESEVCDVAACVGTAVGRAQYRVCVARGGSRGGAAEAIRGATVADQIDDVWLVWTCAC